MTTKVTLMQERLHAARSYLVPPLALKGYEIPRVSINQTDFSQVKFLHRTAFDLYLLLFWLPKLHVPTSRSPYVRMISEFLHDDNSTNISRNIRNFPRISVAQSGFITLNKERFYFRSESLKVSELALFSLQKVLSDRFSAKSACAILLRIVNSR